MMATANDSVHARIVSAQTELTPAAVAVGFGLLAAVGFVLLFLGEPTVHRALHDFRHVAGVTCH